jgi:hypothetical protein
MLAARRSNRLLASQFTCAVVIHRGDRI